jgi:hypothetical protein
MLEICDFGEVATYSKSFKKLGNRVRKQRDAISHCAISFASEHCQRYWRLPLLSMSVTHSNIQNFKTQ